MNCKHFKKRAKINDNNNENKTFFMIFEGCSRSKMINVISPKMQPVWFKHLKKSGQHVTKSYTKVKTCFKIKQNCPMCLKHGKFWTVLMLSRLYLKGWFSCKLEAKMLDSVWWSSFGLLKNSGLDHFSWDQISRWHKIVAFGRDKSKIYENSMVHQTTEFTAF